MRHLGPSTVTADEAHGYAGQQVPMTALRRALPAVQNRDRLIGTGDAPRTWVAL